MLPISCPSRLDRVCLNQLLTLNHSLALPPAPAPLPAQVLRYAARFAADWACLELFTHNLYFNSVAKHRVGLRYGPLGLRYGHLEIGG